VPILPALEELNLAGNPITKISEIGKLIDYKNL
jgi:Leucine-rich repeat (LRR) protein